MSLKLALIFVSASVWCFANKTFAQNVTSVDNVLTTMSTDNITTLIDTTFIDTTLNDTTLNDATLNNTTLNATVEYEQDDNGNEYDDSELNGSNNSEYENDWEKSSKMNQVENYENGARYSNKQDQQEQKENWAYDNSDRENSHHGENKKLHKWGKDIGEVLIKKWKWEKEHGMTEQNGKNKVNNKQNDQKIQWQKEGKINQYEEKAKKNGLKQKYTIKDWKDNGMNNEDQVKDGSEMKSWNEKKPVYIEYQKELELQEKQANKQGYIHFDSILGYAVDNIHGY